MNSLRRRTQVAGRAVVAILALLFRTLVYCRNLWAQLRAGRPYAFSALTAGGLKG